MYIAVKNLQVNPVNLTTKYRNVFLEYGFGSLRAENCEIERGVSLEPEVKILKKYETQSKYRPFVASHFF